MTYLLYGVGHGSSHVTIEKLPDNVLLDIFELCLPSIKGQQKAWHKLVHVCQRWRFIVFASPRRLNLRLLCTPDTHVEKMLDVWPPLPIEIKSSYVLRANNIQVALAHRNRISTISLCNIRVPLQLFVALMQEPFPALEILLLEAICSTEPMLPDTFLGGFASSLRSLSLDGIVFPALPKLLLSCNDLVALSLGCISQSGYISPEALVTCISSLANLSNLSIRFLSRVSYPDPRTRRSLPLTRCVLPALRYLQFRGISEYLEDFVARIDAPLLRDLNIKLFSTHVSDIRQLVLFIDRTPILTSYNRPTMEFCSDAIRINIRSSMSPFRSLCLDVSCRDTDPQVSSMAHICNQLAFIMSRVERLDIECVFKTWRANMDDTQWLELFRTFTALRMLCILSRFSWNKRFVASALRGLGRGVATEVLPALEDFYLSYRLFGSDVERIKRIITARQRSGHPITVYRLGLYFPK
ncbi:hypothetical protein BGW80DRAFT_1460509 [Lactifluus volemus]|nr:hypothetical protein BGW80DRAFT_1460509 [Lactifluus volemus]